MYLPREIEKEIKKWMKKEHVILIKGPRQVGKTTLMKKLKEEFGGSYIDLTDEKFSKILETDPSFFLNLDQPLYFDEIGFVKDAGRKIKTIYDKKKPKIILSGSGAFEIKNKVGKYLVGRVIYFHLNPLSFDEFVWWKDEVLYKYYRKKKEELWKRILKGKTIEVPEMRILCKYYNEYVTWGGYPRVVLEKEEKEKILKSLIETQLEKDMFDFFDIREKELFRAFLKKLSYNIGGLLNISSLGVSHKTALRYLYLLNEEEIIELIPPFHKNLSKELRKQKKIYFYDLGMARVLSENRLSVGQERENFVFLQLVRRFGKEKIKYWRTQSGAEVDFIITKGKNPILPVEVKTSMKKSRSLTSFLFSYGLDVGVMISDKSEVLEKNGKTIYYLEPWWV